MREILFKSIQLLRSCLGCSWRHTKNSVAATPAFPDFSIPGSYLNQVYRITNSSTKFRRFKKNLIYNEVLEHLWYDDGLRYLEILEKDNPELFERLASNNFSFDDSIGSPRKFDFGFAADLSPTTIRYVKVANDIGTLFGPRLGRIVEIGCGYGGQCAILDELFDVTHYTLIDVFPVTDLIQYYLETQVIRGSYKIRTLNQTQSCSPDLVVSNYAFSEFERDIQLRYLDKIIKNSPKGYMIMNSGRRERMDRSKLALTDILTIIPGVECFKEEPLTAPDNYVMVWGHADIPCSFKKIDDDQLFLT